MVPASAAARTLAKGHEERAIYLDLHLPSDLARLIEPEIYFEDHREKLVILDEIQHVPDLFPVLRALVDRDRRPGRFLVLGSASPALLGQAPESLAGRITFEELAPLSLLEVAGQGGDWRPLWIRGGYPSSYLAHEESDSLRWRRAFFETHLGRDLPAFGRRVQAARLRRFWRMLAHTHGQLWNASAFARSFGVSGPTVRGYVDLLEDLYLVRQLPPLHANLKKRLVKSPKVYLRDSGLLHAILDVPDREALHGHPGLGASFEGFVIEQILRACPADLEPHFFRTYSGAEIDLVLTRESEPPIAVEVKYSAAPKLTRGLRQAVEDLACRHAFVVTPGGESFPLSRRVRTMPLERFLEEVAPDL